MDAPAVISDFIYQGASLHNQTDRTGETALHLAARYSRSDAAKRLLEASADANIQDHMGKTPLHAAVSADAQGVFQVRRTTLPSMAFGMLERWSPGVARASPVFAQTWLLESFFLCYFKLLYGIGSAELSMDLGKRSKCSMI